MPTNTLPNDHNGQTRTTGHAPRAIWPDAARIMAVFAMIVMHAAAPGFGRFGARTVFWQVCNLYDSLARFCVPVFVMVSGMFLLSPEKDYGLKKLYFSKIARMATAYLFWAAFYSTVSLVAAVAGGKGSGGRDCVCEFARGMLEGRYHLWFLFMISGLYMATPFLRPIARDGKLSVYFLALGLVFVHGTNTLALFPPMRHVLDMTVNRMHLHPVAGYPCYFLLGHWLSRRELAPVARKAIYLAGILSALGTATLNGLAGYHFDVPGTWLYDDMLPNVLLMAVAVFVFCRYRFQGKRLSPRWQRRIGLAGRWSFGIYLVHLFFLANLPRVGLPLFFCHPIVSIPVVSVVVFSASLAAVSVLDKIPVLNKYAM